MKTSLAELLSRLPTIDAPPGSARRAAALEGLSHGTMTLELLAPAEGPAAEPRLQDTLILVASGTARLDVDGEATELSAGDAAFVPAATPHGFAAVSQDFAGWIVSWGPAGGEAPAPEPSVFAAIDA